MLRSTRQRASTAIVVQAMLHHACQTHRLLELASSGRRDPSVSIAESLIGRVGRGQACAYDHCVVRCESFVMTCHVPISKALGLLQAVQVVISVASLRGHRRTFQLRFLRGGHLHLSIFGKVFGPSFETVHRPKFASGCSAHAAQPKRPRKLLGRFCWGVKAAVRSRCYIALFCNDMQVVESVGVPLSTGADRAASVRFLV